MFPFLEVNKIMVRFHLQHHFDENNDDSGVMNLIGSIGDKVKSKMEGGGLDQDNLVNEANNIMGEFGKMGNGNPLNMLNKLFKGGGMPDLSKMGDLNNMMNPGGEPQEKREPTAKEKRNAKKKALKKEQKKKVEEKSDKILNKALDRLSDK